MTFGPYKAGNKTRAHRFLSSAVVEVTDFEGYKKSLETGHVLLDREDRKAKIKENAEALAAQENLIVKDDPALLDEVAGLVEWPVVLTGDIDAEFLEIPAEVLVTTMRKNQKYFTLQTKDGLFANKFLLVANKETPDGGAAIVAGNDACRPAFRCQVLLDSGPEGDAESRTGQLTNITFHAKLGRSPKMARVAKLADALPASSADTGQVLRAAQLAKADLVMRWSANFPKCRSWANITLAMMER